ncbi:Metallo-dependent hydrolase [Hortaea werneckii]|uniref:N-acetylglucosamine-6-phosphate deacetylase n=1 Tax=Hortaea werneckii TaxID=91943 RepID=A0A3M7J9R3_HORWE|nr:Metallo-dependent hydrolase [Hortaea werneckii]KAI6852139.1 Metallo-dependent hydrolase [Hortaea werneckii]KAI6944098.1 Metallo-dependent hydrolase [Hortaea werneckii]KAI6949815.1 Metallo-dependent hydrolase [Hortaea werneckii]KAI6970674.1 Metallo-dependent hydrolase [Hortaea werneckii]
MTTTFTNLRLCHRGQLLENRNLVISNSTGLIVDPAQATESNAIDLEGAIVAPGFIELQTNGMKGFHFTHFTDKDSYASKIDKVAQYLPSTGVTAFYATIPTVHSDDFKKILPSLAPRDINGSASLLGAHAEGPYLHPSKKGAHNASLFHLPSQKNPASVYGPAAEDNSTLKLVTLAPELDGTENLVFHLSYRGIRTSLGHSSATYDQGLAALKAGANCLTHTLNAMAPLHHRDPGLAGLITAGRETLVDAPSPYFSIIPDGNHLHPAVATMLFRSNPEKCLIITDSIEMAGLPDGTYPGHAQIPLNQTKKGSRVVIEGTSTLIGGCAGLHECVSNLMKWSGCGIAEAVRCATENVAAFMGDEVRGKLETGRRGDFVCLSPAGDVIKTFIGGKEVWCRRP